MLRNILKKVVKVGFILCILAIILLLTANEKLDYQIAGERVWREVTTTDSEIKLGSIGTALVENDNIIVYRAADKLLTDTSIDGTILANLTSNNKPIIPGKKYKEKLFVKNIGTIDQYVRVSIYRYFIDQDGVKSNEFNPEMIKLNYTNLETNWLIDEDASTDERTVLYYKYPIEVGKQSATFVEDITIDSAVLSALQIDSTSKDGRTVITHQNKYSNVLAEVEIKVDAVQDHNAKDAIISAWGRSVTIGANGELSLD